MSEVAMFRNGLTVDDFFLTEEELAEDKRTLENHTAFLMLSMELDREPPAPIITNHGRKYQKLADAYRSPDGIMDSEAFTSACDLALSERLDQIAKRNREAVL